MRVSPSFLSLFLLLASYRGMLGISIDRNGQPLQNIWGIHNSVVGLVEVTQGSQKRVFVIGELSTKKNEVRPEAPHAGVGLLWEL